MEIFERSLSNFKKPLIIVVIVVLVCLSGFVVADFALNLGPNISCGPIAEMNFTESKISEGFNGEDFYSVDATLNMPRASQYCSDTYVYVYGLDSGEKIDYDEGHHGTDWSTDFSYGYTTKGGNDVDRFVTDENGFIEGVVLLNRSDTARVAGLEKGDTVVVVEQVNNGDEIVGEYTVE